MTTPLPDRRALVARSGWVREMPGLATAAARWQRTLPAVRRDLEADAVLLAQPRLWLDTISAFAATGWKLTSTAVPEAPFALLSAAAGAMRLPIAPPRGDRAPLQRAQRLVRAGGPAYIKLGQFIASAQGLLPDEWVQAFGWCRDRAPALSADVVHALLRAELGDGFSAVRDLDPTPLAAASIAQVHAARLDDGTEIVVKIRRPGLHEQLRGDIETMALAAAAAERLHPAARTANLTGFVELFSELVLQELDLRLEALNLVELGAAFEDAGIDYCTLPRPIPGLVTDGVLAMERVGGVAYDAAADTYGAQLNGDRLLELAIRGVLETTLVYGIFHGDLHAGNVLIDGGDTFALVDFGICGRIDAAQRAALVRFMLAFAQMDAGGQIDALELFGALPAGVDRTALAAELQHELDAINPAAGHSLTFDEVGVALSGILRILSAARFRLPKELVLFFKNLLYLTGFTASVAPDADLLSQVQPVLEHFLRKYGDELSAAFAAAV